MTSPRSYLIVDDNQAFAENLAEILTDTGAAVRVVASGEDALKAARTFHFSALLTDMRMPGMDGARLVHGIREVDPGLPAVVMTAYTDNRELALARREGLLAVLPKPVPLIELIALMGAARRDGLVAIVEDDEALCDNLTEVLQSKGLTTVLAGSVLETERLAYVQPFVGIVDLRVPGGPDGEAMRQLATRFPGLPLLVVSAHADLRPPLDHAGYFPKPFETTALLARVEQLHERQFE